MAKKVFFSFHYKDVIEFRANVVRNHWRLKLDRESAGYFDKSVWESAKGETDLGLKRLINGALAGCSTTCVLIGSDTWARRWVQYEIMKSFKDGKKILGVHINSIRCKDGQAKAKGANPFTNLGVVYSTSGLTATLKIKRNGAWFDFTDIGGSASFEIERVPEGYRGKGYNFARFFPVYDWVGQDGYNMFATWVA